MRTLEARTGQALPLSAPGIERDACPQRAGKHAVAAQKATALPAAVPIYEVPAEMVGEAGHQYTVVNEQPVLVERRTRRIVRVLEKSTTRFGRERAVRALPMDPGSALIIYEREDDQMSPPDGKAGDRVACAVLK